MVTGCLYNTPLTLVSVYGPNFDDEHFFSTFFASLPDLITHRLIIGGDFNCVLDPKLDRSSNKTQTLTKSAKLIRSFMGTFKIIDPWRFKYPTSRSSPQFIIPIVKSIIFLLIVNFYLRLGGVTTRLSSSPIMPHTKCSWLSRTDICPGLGALTTCY